MHKSENPVKMFISSRPDREYLEAFADETIITVDASSQHEDIERFLAEKLYATKFFQQRSQVIQNEIINVFASKSCGMFRWVYLQVMSLRKRTTDEAIYNWACNLPVDLMAAYDRLWENIQEHDESDTALAKRAIMWVLCSFEPLETEVLLQAIRYNIQGSILLINEKQTQEQILLLCQDLLTIDEERGVWMLPHASVAEYFEKRGWMNLWECDIFASQVCLNILDKRLPNDDDYFASYIAYNWVAHVGRCDRWLGSREQEVEQKAHPDLAAALKQFLGSPDKGSANFQCWVRSRYGSESIPIPLHVMCEYGFYYILRDWWIQPGKITAKIALKETFHRDALCLAAQGRFMPICRHLAKLIEAVHPKGDTYYTRAFTTSIRVNHFDMVNFFISEMKADVNSARRERLNRYTAAQTAAMLQPEMLQWLMDRGVVDLERENDNNCPHGNVLVAAVSSPNVKSVRILLKAGANTNAVVMNGKYRSALVAAADCKHTRGNSAEIVQLLLDHGADPNLPLGGGQWGSALEASVARNWDSRFEEDRRNMQLLLLEAGADPTVVSQHGEYGSALAAAAFWGQQENLKTMIDKIGAERAIEVLGQSRHPDERRFEEQEDVTR